MLRSLGAVPFAIAALLAAAAHGDSLYDKNSDVVELTVANFQKEVVKSDAIWIVEFFAPW